MDEVYQSDFIPYNPVPASERNWKADVKGGWNRPNDCVAAVDSVTPPSHSAEKSAAENKPRISGMLTISGGYDILNNHY